MKSFGTLLELGAVILMFSAPAFNAMADPQWVDVKVDRAGYSAEPNIGIKLTHDSPDPLFTRKWYKARPDVAEGMLSLAVWALETDSILAVYLDPFAPGWSEIEQMHLK